jgi:hypothetical protein
MSGLVGNPFLLTSAGGATGYQIERSLRFNSSDSAYLSRTPASAGNRKTWTWAGWVKLGALGTVRQIFTSRPTSSPYALFYIFSDDKISFADNTLNTHTTTAVYRDPSAWYHIQLAVDTTNATSANRVRLWVNGVLQTWASTTAPTQNADGQINTATAHSIGSPQPYASSEYFNGYLADIHFIDGQALDPTSFTEVDATTGQLIPKQYTGSFGTNGFWLKFSDNSAATATTLGKDYSGNSNNWTPNNLSVTAGAGNDSLVDTPTSYGTDTGAGGEVRGNYCTLNPLDRSSNVTLANGNLDWSNSTAGNVRATASFNGGKFYCEAVASTAGNYGFGIGRASSSLSGNIAGGITGVYAWNWNGSAYNFHSSGSYPWSASGSSSDVLQIAIDASNPASVKLFLGRQNTWYDSSGGTTANPATGANPTATLTDNVDWFLFTGGANTANAVSVNMGARPFAYTAPSGFKALCTANLPAPLVTKPSAVMDVVLYTGTGSALTPTSTLGFNPDLVWIKSRSAATDHAWYDAVRGAEKRLESNNTDDEVTTDGGVTAFNSNGFTLGTLAQVNTNAATYVAWCWDENVSAGFDIVTYTGNGSARTINHSLGVVPSLIIVKARTTASTDQGWPVYHSANTANPETDYLLLNSTAATADLDTVWNDTAPTSSVFSVGTNALVNANNDTYVAYCFAPVAGYSSFGSYTGNGSTTDNTFVYTGMRPRFVLLKRSDSTGNWVIWDAVRNSYNVANSILLPNTSAAEYSPDAKIDILSNGFKIRDNSSDSGTNGATYIYAAFSEVAFNFARAR